MGSILQEFHPALFQRNLFGIPAIYYTHEKWNLDFMNGSIWMVISSRDQEKEHCARPWVSMPCSGSMCTAGGRIWPSAEGEIPVHCAGCRKWLYAMLSQAQGNKKCFPTDNLSMWKCCDLHHQRRVEGWWQNQHRNGIMVQECRLRDLHTPTEEKVRPRSGFVKPVPWIAANIYSSLIPTGVVFRGQISDTRGNGGVWVALLAIKGD